MSFAPTPDYPIPTIGRIVHYRLSQSDVDIIISQRSKSGLGGNYPYEGQIFPMIIVAVWGSTSDSYVNGRVLIDGEDHALWVTSVRVGEGPRTFSWPPRA